MIKRNYEQNENREGKIKNEWNENGRKEGKTELEDKTKINSARWWWQQDNKIECKIVTDTRIRKFASHYDETETKIQRYQILKWAS